MDSEEAAENLNLPWSLLSKIVEAPDVEHALSEWRRLLPELQSYAKSKLSSAHPDKGGNGEVFLKTMAAYRYLKSEDFAVSLWGKGRSAQVVFTEGANGVTIPDSQGVFDFREPNFLRRM